MKTRSVVGGQSSCETKVLSCFTNTSASSGCCTRVRLFSTPVKTSLSLTEHFGRELDPAKVAIIREVYDSENAHEKFEQELERALEAGCSIIVVEPSRLGDETARWIAVGNCLHKTAVLSGLGAISTGLLWTERPYLCTPLGALSLLCTGVYTISWQFDPCVQYQVERDSQKLAKLLTAYPFRGALGSASPVVLVRRDNSRRKILHTSISLIAAVFCAWRLYDAYK